MRVICIAAAAAMVAGCGSGANQAAQAETTAATLQPGGYELSWSDISFKSTAKGEPAKSPDKAAFATRACVAEGGKIELGAFAEEGDDCHAVNSYARNGILNIQLSCMREGKGKVGGVISGSFEADSFDATVDSRTNFAESGNYTVSAKVTGKRTGECSAAKDA